MIISVIYDTSDNVQDEWGASYLALRVSALIRLSVRSTLTVLRFPCWTAKCRAVDRHKMYSICTLLPPVSMLDHSVDNVPHISSRMYRGLQVQWVSEHYESTFIIVMMTYFRCNNYTWQSALFCDRHWSVVTWNENKGELWCEKQVMTLLQANCMCFYTTASGRVIATFYVLGYIVDLQPCLRIHRLL